MLLRTILHDGGFKVVGEASNGATGLQAAIKHKPHAICLDIQLPDSDGLDVLKKILAELPNALILMVTGQHDAATVQTAIQNGAKGFIVKPFNSSTVLSTLKSAVTRHAQTLKNK